MTQLLAVLQVGSGFVQLGRKPIVAILRLLISGLHLWNAPIINLDSQAPAFLNGSTGKAGLNQYKIK
ncbi:MULTISPECIES: hypothetical protein [Paraburkholderia]|uniref:hypothetical protein n=1 Tax=Paraburkholderia TaxID=1822464 RepID=UPI0013EABE68|nr:MULTISPECIES: hypothetical protein [Paraburkholderia]MDR8395904.1 hypothetical protein [Paraburkholderia sp. USG1]